MPQLVKYQNFLLICLLVWFVGGTLHGAFYKGLEYDDAFNANLAENVSLGLGWATHYHEIVPFNHKVTTGPGLLLPAALAIKLFGNEIWVPSMVTATIMLAGLLLAIWQLYRLEPDGFNPTVALAVSVLLYSLFEIKTWQILLGDGPIAILLINLCLLLARANSPGTYLLAGLTAAMAILTKVYAVIAIAGVLAFWLLMLARSSDTRGSIFYSVWMLLGVLLLLLPWQVYKNLSLAAMPLELAESNAILSRRFFLYYGSGIGQWLDATDKLSYLVENSSRNFLLLASHLATGTRGLLAAVLFILLLLLGTAWTTVAYLRGDRRPVTALLGLLGMAALSHLGWFLLIMFGDWARYTRIPLLLGILFIPLLLSRFLGTRNLVRCAAIYLLLVPAPTWQRWADFALWRSEPTRDTRDILTLRDELTTLAYRGPLAGCGWVTVRKLEYLLPGHGHFKDCIPYVAERVDEMSAHQGNMLPLDLYFTLVTNESIAGLADDHFQKKRPETLIRKRFCRKLIARQGDYTVHQCHVKKIPRKLGEQISRFSRSGYF